MTSVKLINIGIKPEAAVSGAVVLQSEYSTYLLFNAMKENSDGLYADSGIGVIEYKGCLQSKFGYPNDEAAEGHPLNMYFEEADGFYDFYEVLDSPWLKELSQQNQKVFPGTNYTHRHFVVFFHDSTFECLANDFEVSNYNESTASVLAKLSEKIASE
jgi:hypothetical protein